MDKLPRLVLVHIFTYVHDYHILHAASRACHAFTRAVMAMPWSHFLRFDPGGTWDPVPPLHALALLCHNVCIICKGKQGVIHKYKLGLAMHSQCWDKMWVPYNIGVARRIAWGDGKPLFWAGPTLTAQGEVKSKRAREEHAEYLKTHF